MARWSEIEEQAPELATAARGFLDAFTHKTLATLRRDGAPRISGTEVDFSDGDAWIGSMWQARKAQDLQRDPRFAIHSGSADPPGWKGDAKLAGRAVEVDDDAVKGRRAHADEQTGPWHLFRLEITELVVIRLGDPADHLIVESWHEGRGVTRQRR
jgi:Pyridoxamine 5'-phosphate oxidase